MEKAVVFGPLIIFFGFFAILVILFLGFIVKLVMKSKNEEWMGKIIDKKITTIEDDNGIEKDNYFLVVEIEGSRNRNIAMSRQMWESFEIGDKIKKPKGKLIPEKY